MEGIWTVFGIRGFFFSPFSVQFEVVEVMEFTYFLADSRLKWDRRYPLIEDFSKLAWVSQSVWVSFADLSSIITGSPCLLLRLDLA